MPAPAFVGVISGRYLPRPAICWLCFFAAGNSAAPPFAHLLDD